MSPGSIIKNYGTPSVVITSIGTHRVPRVDNFSSELIDDQILSVEFEVFLVTVTGSLADSAFSFHLKFAEEN